MKSLRNNIALVLAIVLSLAAIWLLGGCAEKLAGTQKENQQPTVWFVNVPPESSQSSVNPIINWVGQDTDGQIAFFRFIVVREMAIGQAIGKPPEWHPASEPLTQTEVDGFVNSVLNGYNDTLWTVLDVDLGSEDPQTSNIVPMSAEIDDPVLTYVPQFVFLQAFDEDGMGSEIAFRRFFRNDNPPDTRMVGFLEDNRFINAIVPGASTNTGIRLRWAGSDIIDYPTDPPDFEFEWRMYGPFTDDQYTLLIDSFTVPVFVTNDAQVFRFNQEPVDTAYEIIYDPISGDSIGIDTIPIPTYYEVCDTSFVGGMEVVNCDTIFIDTITRANVYGYVDTILRVNDDDFINSAEYNVVAKNSDDGFGDPWVLDTRDSLYNVYESVPSDTTLQMSFVFWIRSRDDAKVPDLTPFFARVNVIDPRYERDVLVFDMASPASIQKGNDMAARHYWDTVVNLWAQTPERIGDNIEFDYEIDFNTVQGLGNNATNILTAFLSHKLVILLQDDVRLGAWSNNANNEAIQQVYVALESNVNMWLATRCPIGGYGEGAPPDAPVFSGADYYSYFGVEQTVFSGWSWWALRELLTGQPSMRIEDFVGTYSLDPNRWPDLEIDTARLHALYNWGGISPYYDWDPAIGALPEVDWEVRTPNTEAIYLYKSLYGSDHPLGIVDGVDYRMDGRPVAHRLNGGSFRTVQTMFSPMPFKRETADQFVFAMLSWLWEGRQ